MKKRLLALFLALAICLGLAQAFAVEGATFTDVPADAWFAPYVECVSQAGIMIGTGEGQFSPHEELSGWEASVLALRLHNLANGGDGTFENAPKDWGQVTLTTAGGDVYTGNLGTEGLWQNAGATRQDRMLLYPESDRQKIARSQDKPAVVTYNGVEWPGTFLYYQSYQGVDYAAFLPDTPDEFWPVLFADWTLMPPEDAWYRDAWYYGATHGLERVMENPGDNRRDALVFKLALVTELPVLNHIDSLPDTENAYALELYRAGVLTGINKYGVFAGERPLTRAESAAMAARVLEPDLRLTFTPEPLPTGGYTLTYLMDGTADCGAMYPILPLSGSEGGAAGLLTLDGRLLPWPGNVPSFGLDSGGGYLHVSCWNEDTPDPWDLKTGMLDAAGEWVVPMGKYDQIHRARTSFLAGITGELTTHWYRLDDRGQVIEDLGTNEPDWNDDDNYPFLESYRGIRLGTSNYDTGYYADGNGVPVSQKFDWGSRIGPDGSGFVGLDRKIYRIDFAQ